jgi:hypothetical protein
VIAGSVHSLLDQPEFRSGVAAGAGLAALGVAAGLLATDRGRRVVPIGGLLVAIGFVLGSRSSPHLPKSIPVGLLLLAAGGLAAGRLARRQRALALLGIAFATPGAVVLAAHTRVHAASSVHSISHAAWIAPLVALSIIVGGPLLADFDRRYGARGWPMALYAVSVVGVYFTVPDTERALVLLGVSLPLALLGWPFTFVSLGSAGSYAAVGVLVWVGATDGRGRQAAIVGAIACLGLLVVDPAARVLRRRRSTVFALLPTSVWAVVPVVALHLALVYIASRVAGLRHSLRTAVTIVLLELFISGAMLFLFNPPTGPALLDSEADSDEVA